ncbi:L-seryl-tRNA(Sec) selenium transferase [Pseudogulbenkiania subflava]|uniref:L-seryl-tRNA(Sec) selenium transferase n=1 Tax=Pseudogulbenkiania subflava DSM 22618 TaxID=1123014 RepID=A0A1Y6CEW1_9NEIS|nr:L-seryl-tRNA(Sec) selenium transferase [Pseudogulbenkiania subflava]SMF48766.1 L-seryl-tRNA(Sec) selenium transferase [Pseudogulbenkiania subflava DSM 22618]
MDSQTLYSRLPSIDKLLLQPGLADALQRHGREAVLRALRQRLDMARRHIREHGSLPVWASDEAPLLNVVRHELAERQQLQMRPVFNLTGTVLHTNLGRAQLPEAAVAAVMQAMRAPVALEYDLDGAGRGHRDQAVSELLRELTGAEAACVVNNNAAAVLIMLSTMAAGREVIVSRGELVEIGGAFRMPDVMRQAGCRLVEVGATNRTHLRDYAEAIGPDTALLMKVHTSNYAIEGFTHSVSEAELARLAAARGVPLVTDLGSGALADMTRLGLPAEPMPQQMIAAGVNLVSFSGDKLLGGPQAGLIIGDAAWIARIQKHPLKRALRCDKMTLAALEATLRLYLEPENLPQALPTLRLLTRPQQAMQQQAERLCPALRPLLDEAFVVGSEPCLSQIGSGSLPVDRLPSWAITLSPRDGRGSTLDSLSRALRALPRPVIGRVQDGRLWLDLRCLEDEAGLMANLAQLPFAGPETHS